MSKLIRRALGASLLLGAGYLFCIAPRMKGKYTPAREPFRTSYAHRGLHGAGVPENSMTAFREAVRKGYGIELDLQLSRDGEIMVFHDYELERVTGKRGRLSDHDAEELHALRLAGTEEQIPYFREVLSLVDGKVPLLIELKGESLTDMRLCKAVEELLRGYPGPYCIESFNPAQLRWWKKNCPGVVRGQLVTDLTRKKDGSCSKNPADYLLTGLCFNVCSRPDFISADGRMKNPSVKLCETVFRADRFVWTVMGDGNRRACLEKKQYPIFEYVPTDFHEGGEEDS